MTIKSPFNSCRLAPLFAAVAGAGAALLASASAAANPRPLPFTYPYGTLAEGEAELEQYVDATPLRIADPETGTGKVWELGYKLQTELEYGITDRLELGLYVVGGQEAGGGFQIDGTKQRLRLRLAEEGQWPIDVALYGEVAELHDEIELEEKLILQRRFGRVRAMANLWFEQSFEHFKGEPELSFDPTAGLTAEITPNLHVGAEYWARIALEDEDEEKGGGEDFAKKPHHFVGPAVSLQWGKLWWTTALYKRLDEATRTVQIGDPYGQYWVRSVVGVNL